MLNQSDSRHLPKLSRLTLITIRFTTSIPDLLLDVPDDGDTNVVDLRQLLRAELESGASKCRIRLIHNGKLLKDEDLLSAVLKKPSSPPRLPDLKGKGKAVEPPRPRIYINCALGDVLTDDELAAERKAVLNKGPRTQNGQYGYDAQNTTTTTPAPRGFDRLIAGGFTQAEVNQLRLQFLSIQSSMYTPDTMPSQETLRQMEDAWMDDNAAGTGRSGGGFDFGDDALGGGALDDLLWGNIIGFMWPLGCMMWAIREEGVWSARRKMAVFTGFLISVSFGFLSVLG